jgi:hypothetical protein
VLVFERDHTVVLSWIPCIAICYVFLHLLVCLRNNFCFRVQSLDRERLVVELTVPTGGDKARFILAGCAMFLEAS